MAERLAHVAEVERLEAALTDSSKREGRLQA